MRHIYHTSLRFMIRDIGRFAEIAAGVLKPCSTGSQKT
jgi:hypothetical protein